jgi:hypothetical protein
MSMILRNINADGKNIRKFYVHKSYNITQDTATGYGLRIGAGISGLADSYIRDNSLDLMGPLNSDTTYQYLLFKSMHQTYYTTHSADVPAYRGQQKVSWYVVSHSLSGSVIPGRGYVSSSSTSSVMSINRIAVIGIPRSAFGETILPNSLQITDSEIAKTIVDDGVGNLTFKYPDSFPTPAYTMSLTLNGITTVYSTASIVGNVFYEHGIALIITGSAGYLFASGTISSSVSFKNSVPIYEHEYMCTVPVGELNTTQNPSAIIYDSNGNPTQLQSFVTHSQFMPYITAVGLYDDSGYLVAISKFSKPVKKIPWLDYTFCIKFDA